MARYTGPSCRLCRREGQKLYLKGERCYSDKCAVNRRAYAPGQHGQGRKKISNYGLQLREKQKAKRAYGLLESQFRAYFEKAEKMQGITGENLLTILETRLDNVVFRMGFGASRKEARQLVRHGHFIVNGKKVDIPSFLVSVGDVIKVKEKSVSSPKFKAMTEAATTVAKWVDVNAESLEGKVVSLPTREDIDIPIAEHLIVELYSR
ncbi:MAG: 30S ribosomal protein S4 [Marinisporobacter sp.]|jgi:small subunit ribosomal protein S4|nr:30S ribosomal protein S4 [Marinisporobacter sp.]